jgi:hypothetical protein
MTQSDLATAMDYVEALGAARKAKRGLVILLLAVLVGQLAIFFFVHFGPELPASHGVERSLTKSDYLVDFLKTIVGLFQFLGVILPILLAADLLLILNILLLGRLIGVARIVSAFLWCVLLATLLFPWQAFLANQTFTTTAFRIPGVLYSWDELAARSRWVPGSLAWQEAWLRWARFVVIPAISMAVLLAVQIKSTRGLKLAQGEIKPKAPGT